MSRLNKLCEIPENAYLVSFDALGSYPHKPYEEDLKILKCCLDKREDQWVSSENLCGLVKIILKHNYFNYFELVSDMCHQLLGTGISTKFTPNYANNFIAGSEGNFFKKLKFKPYLWIRYFDDIFYIWTDGLDKWIRQSFLIFLNEFHPSIKFTMDYSKNTINFLDVKVSKSESGITLYTRLFAKPTDTHQYLHATSCHRSIYKRAIPFGEAVKIKRISSDEEDPQQKLNDLESWLIDRGYTAEVARPEIQKVNSINRNVMLEKTPKHEEDSVTLILTLFDILKSAHRHIEKSPLLKSVQPKLLRVAFRNPKSLRDKLI